MRSASCVYRAGRHTTVGSRRMNPRPPLVELTADTRDADSRPFDLYDARGPALEWPLKGRS